MGTSRTVNGGGDPTGRALRNRMLNVKPMTTAAPLPVSKKLLTRGSDILVSSAAAGSNAARAGAYSAAPKAVRVQQTPMDHQPKYKCAVTISVVRNEVTCNTIGLDKLLHKAPLKGANTTAGNISRPVTKCQALSSSVGPCTAKTRTTISRSALSAITRATCEPHSDANRTRALHTSASQLEDDDYSRLFSLRWTIRQPVLAKSPRTAVRGLESGVACFRGRYQVPTQGSNSPPRK